MTMIRRFAALICSLVLAAPQAFPASLLTVSKTPFEAFNCSVDFTPVAGADGITLIGVVSTNVQTGADTTAAIIASSPVPAVNGSTDVVVFRVQAGVAGERHVVGVRVQEKVTGEIFEGQITVAVNSGR